MPDRSRGMPQPGEHIHLVQFPPRGRALVSAERAIAEPLERPSSLVRLAHRSGRAFDGIGRYRRLAPPRVHFELLSSYPTSMPTDEPADRAEAFGRDQRVARACRGAFGFTRLFFSELRGALGLRVRDAGRVFLAATQIERRLGAKSKRSHRLRGL